MLDPNGDHVGRVRDVVIQNRSRNRAPRVKGLVVELFATRRIFYPMARVRSIDAHQVIVSGLVNTRRFEAREAEVLVIDHLFDRTVTRGGSNVAETIFDVAIQRTRAREWEVSEVALREPTHRPFARGHVTVVDWSELPDFIGSPAARDAEQLVARLAELKPADVARELHDMDPLTRAQVVQAMDDEDLAGALEELPEDEQVELIATLDRERAADVLEEMDPDDAADLIAEL
ncbi:MAG: magnesium transporter, partial [Propionibacteriaceae bacterium]|nr:magnesium transporter [Propionibacteriaceae bacterium]